MRRFVEDWLFILERAGGVVRVPIDWFRDYEPPAGSGFMVNEEEDAVVIRSIVVDGAAAEAAPLESAGRQTEGG